MLGHLVPVDHLPDAHADGRRAAQRLALAPGRRRDGRQVLLGGRQQLLPLALPFGGQQRIAAHDQPLAGELLAADLGQVPLVEQRRRHRAGSQQFANRRRPQGGDPAQPVDALQVLADARCGQHAAVAHQHHPLQAEAGADLVHLAGHRLRVARRALEDLHRDRTARARTCFDPSVRSPDRLGSRAPLQAHFWIGRTIPHRAAGPAPGPHRASGRLRRRARRPREQVRRATRPKLPGARVSPASARPGIVHTDEAGRASPDLTAVKTVNSKPSFVPLHSGELGDQRIDAGPGQPGRGDHFLQFQQSHRLALPTPHAGARGSKE